MHIVGPFGFRMDDRILRRSSVGHWMDLRPHTYVDFESFWREFPRSPETQFIFATKRGQEIYTELRYADDVVLIFGNEEEGVDESFWNFADLPPIVSCRIPTQSVRCLNLSNAVAVMGFEVVRQKGWGFFSLTENRESVLEA